MRILVVLSVIVAVTAAAITHFGPSPLYTTAAIPIIPTAQLYHNQDSLGQYSYGYSGGPSVKSEQKTLDGITRGTYSYIDSNGQLQTVQYTADSLNGFRVAATNLPIAPTDDKKSPEPVQDTPEVAQAKIEHLNAFREAEMRAAKDENDVDENGMPNDSNSLENDNNENGNDNMPPADTTQTNHLISSINLHELRPVNIPAAQPQSQSYIHVTSPIHDFSSRIYGPSIIRHPLTFSSYTTSPKILSSGYILTNNHGYDHFGNIHLNNGNGH